MLHNRDLQSTKYRFNTKTSTPAIKGKSIFNKSTFSNALFIGKEFLKELPKELSKQVGQPALRGFASVGAKIQARDPNALFVPQGDFQKNLLGTDKPINFTSVAKEVTGKKDRPIINPALGGFFALADAIPGGKGVKQGVKVGIKEGKPLFKGFTDITTRVLDKLKGKSVVNKQFINDLTNAPDMRQAERDIIREEIKDAPKNINVKEFADKVRTRLVPLKSDNGLSFGNTPRARYEGINLPDEQRGNVKDYKEIIFRGPIKNSAGDTHFNGEGVDNYFAHVRLEDMADGKTQNILELQSDLFQKGGLEDKIARNAGNVYNVKANIAQLQPYRNTWYERIIRETIKKAKDTGKRYIQFPTGETAMKIEGLGESDNFFIKIKNTAGIEGAVRNIKKEELKVGALVRDDASIYGREWIITDVLGDGKFKAVPKDIIKNKNNIDEFKNLNTYRQTVEQFDISGKVDTSNPIYKFYEKDVQKFLNKNFNGKRIIDENGVERIKIDLNNINKGPVLAHGGVKTGVASSIAGITAAGVGVNNLSNSNKVSYEKKTRTGPKKPSIESATPKRVKLDTPTRENTIGGVNFSKYASSTDAIPEMRRYYKEFKDKKINTISRIDKEIDRLKKVSGKDTPLTGSVVINAARRYGVDPMVILAVIRKETSMGTNLLTDNNFGNILNTDEGGKKHYPSLQEGVNAVARELQRRMIKKPF